MESPVERDNFRRWRWMVILAVLVLLALQAAIMGWTQKDPVTCRLIFDVFASVNPNFIAGLVGAFVLYLFVKTDDRTHYIKAMRSLRQAVGQLREGDKITSEDVQSLMRTFVPTISRLYFKKDQPSIASSDAKKHYAKQQCFACNKPSPVECGRCTECDDILDSWRAEERSGVA